MLKMVAYWGGGERTDHTEKRQKHSNALLSRFSWSEYDEICRGPTASLHCVITQKTTTRIFIAGKISTSHGSVCSFLLNVTTGQKHNLKTTNKYFEHVTEFICLIVYA
jgi:hypothetical protein